MQESIVLSGTIGDNLRYGRLDVAARQLLDELVRIGSPGGSGSELREADVVIVGRTCRKGCR